MTSIDPDWLASIRADYGQCFGCGLDNPIGLQVDGFAQDGDTITAGFEPRALYAGFHGVLHGGVLATALDEILAWTAILVAGTMAVTVKMDFKFRNPAPPDAAYQLEGRLVEQRGKRLILEGSCSTGGKVVAEAKALFLATAPVRSRPSR
jgi:acyl-coenzyme A thioesterase PaaI-like protein